MKNSQPPNLNRFEIMFGKRKTTNGDRRQATGDRRQATGDIGHYAMMSERQRNVRNLMSIAVSPVRQDRGGDK
jgi:hypothetical protein